MRTIAERNEEYFELGRIKTTRKINRMFILAMFGGMFAGFGSIGFTFGCHYGGTRLIGALLFPIGIILNTLAGAEVFMGNSMLSFPLLARKIKLWRFIMTQIVVFIGNFVGAVFIAALTAGSGALEIVSEFAVENAVIKASFTPTQAFLRGYLCNMLITLGIWASLVAKSTPGKIMSLYFPIVVFVIAGFENSITNIYFLSSGALASFMYHGSEQLPLILRGFVTNLVPVAIGNLFGGMTIGAMYKFAYVEKEKKNRRIDN